MGIIGYDYNQVAISEYYSKNCIFYKSNENCLNEGEDFPSYYDIFSRNYDNYNRGIHET
jgi:hypothetical protein